MKTIIVLAFMLFALSVLSGCEHTKARPVSGAERAFHLEHGAGAYTPRRGYGRHHWQSH